MNVFVDVVVVGYECAAVTASLSYILIPLSLTSELLCIAALNFFRGRTGRKG